MLPLLSSVTNEMITDPSQLDARYWRRNLECPVLFSDAVKKIMQQGGARQVFLEVGPHAALAGPLRQIFQSLKTKPLPFYVPTLTRHDDDCRARLLSATAHVYTAGMSVDLSKVIGEGNTLTDLPLYPWEHSSRYWSESRLSRDWRLRPQSHHELLGSRVAESTDHEPSWRNLLRLESVPWLWDHVLNGDIIFPGAGYIAMAGEAVQQLHPDSNSGSYSIRNVIFKVPLLLRDGEFAEVITNLKPVEIADNVHCGWYTFTIEVYDGKTWTQHCQGQVYSGCEQPPETKVIQPFVRAVPSDRWFRAVNRTGLKFGPEFRGLKDITGDPTGSCAAATLTDPHKLHNSQYALHPTAIDQCFQLLGVAACSGITRNLNRAYVPATIDSIFIENGGPHMAAEARTCQAPRDGQRGDAIAMFGDRAVLSLKGCYLFAMDAETGSERSAHLATRIKWKPDIDMLPPGGLLPAPNDSKDHANNMRSIGKICLLYILNTADRIRDVDSDLAHLIKWKHWIMAEASKIAEGKQSIYPDSPQWVHLGTGERERIIKQEVAEHGRPNNTATPICMQQIYDYCLDFMNGKASPLQTLMQHNHLEQYYVAGTKHIDWAKFLDLQCHTNPALRILEIGAGTGVATRDALKHLKSKEGVRLYSQYMFTDISPAFMGPAKESFGQKETLEYHVLDISRDPLKQGFKPHSFDLIIASNVSFARPLKTLDLLTPISTGSPRHAHSPDYSSECAYAFG